MNFDLNEVVEESVRLFAEGARAKGLELASLIHAEVPIALRGDPGRLRQVLVNLVGNAVKFSDSGEIIVDVSKEFEDSTHVQLHFSVQDQGIGIPPEVQAKLFSPFTQADGSTTRKYGGTGLGLAISRRLVERMDGQISVDSAVGRGVVFLSRPFRIARDNCEAARISHYIWHRTRTAGESLRRSESGKSVFRGIRLH